MTFHKTLPSATTTSQGGKLSWRVQILPFIEQAALFNQFKHDEPWDSEHNKKLIAQMPSTYKSPASQMDLQEGKTNYLTVRGEKTLFPDQAKGVGFRDVTDGLSRTIMVIEADDERAVIWTKPDDYELDIEKPTAGLGSLHAGGIFNVLLADGSVRAVSVDIDPQVVLGLFTRDGGETGGHFNVPDPLLRIVPRRVLQVAH